MIQFLKQILRLLFLGVYPVKEKPVPKTPQFCTITKASKPDATNEARQAERNYEAIGQGFESLSLF